MKIDLEGYDIDNLLRLLYLKRVRLYNVRRHCYTSVSFEIDRAQEKKVKRYIRNFKAKLEPRPMQKISAYLATNIGALLGVFFGFLMCIWTSNYTWQILVYGTQELSVDDIVQVLADNGIEKGDINLETSEEIENILLTKYDRIAQVSVIRQGTAIIINLSEKLIYNEQDYDPIVARYNGVITDINIITGTANVRVGDYVNAGDILVLPFNVNTSGEKVGVEPLAEISGRIYVVGKAELPREETVLTPSGNKISTYDYSLWGKHLFSGRNKNSFAFFNTFVYNEYISDVLPIQRTITVYEELVESVIVHDLARERDGVVSLSRERAYNGLAHYDSVIDENVDVTIVQDKLIAITTLILEGLLNG